MRIEERTTDWLRKHVKAMKSKVDGVHSVDFVASYIVAQKKVLHDYGKIIFYVILATYSVGNYWCNTELTSGEAMETCPEV